mmetsp:Transcript_16867/g.29823  ORF Transcript_16867/g.29823 Transcript_16867/m.29823 type:complete len:284 (-) Transcript_16867:49-900(-)
MSIKVAVAQLCSSMNKASNLATCSSLVRSAREGGAKFVAFPEAFDFMGRPGSKDSLELAEPLDGPTMRGYLDLAKDQGVWLSLGGFHERIAGVEGKIANTHVIVDDLGAVRATYRKVHLFDVDYDGGYRESDTTVRGEELVVVRDTPIGTIGVTTCYDIRFPHMYTALRDKGCDVFLAPSAFMPTTGAAHWHVLMRARAIENQCFLIAAAQAGEHNLDDPMSKVRTRESFGHSIVVDPFGKVLVDLEKEVPAVRVVELDLPYIEQIRLKMPVKEHREKTSFLF